MGHTFKNICINKRYLLSKANAPKLPKCINDTPVSEAWCTLVKTSSRVHLTWVPCPLEYTVTDGNTYSRVRYTQTQGQA